MSLMRARYSLFLTQSLGHPPLAWCSPLKNSMNWSESEWVSTMDAPAELKLRTTATLISLETVSRQNGVDGSSGSRLKQAAIFCLKLGFFALMH